MHPLPSRLREGPGAGADRYAAPGQARPTPLSLRDVCDSPQAGGAFHA